MADQGLSSSRIGSIYQDRDGFIWVAGENGLDRLTGDHIQTFRHKEDNPFSLSSNNITDLYMDSDKQLWVGTGKGLHKYSGKNNRFEHILLSGEEVLDRPFSISSIIESSAPGMLVVGTSGYGLFVIDRKDATVDQPASDRLSSLVGHSFIGNLLLDARGWLWVSTGGAGFCVVDLKSGKRIHLKKDPTLKEAPKYGLISCFRLDPQTGNVLIGTASDGLYIYDAKKMVLRKPVDGTLRDMNIQSLLVRKDGTILIGSENRGVWVFDRASETAQPFVVPNNNIVNLGHSKVHALLEDNEGNLWAGLYQKGLFIVPKSISGFEYFAISDDASGKNNSCVTGFARDLDGNIWIATDGGGLFRASGNDLSRLQAKNNGLTCQSMLSMAVDRNGTVWAGSYGKGLFGLKGDVFTQPDLMQQITNDKVMCLEYDLRRNFLYVGTNGGGFNLIDLTKNEVRHSNVPINNWIRALHVDYTGRLWIGTSDGAFYYDVDRDRLLATNIGIARYNPTNCFEERDHLLYIGTSAGLVEYDLKQNKFQELDQCRNQESNNIMAMAIGEDQSLWLTTPKSLSRMNLKSKRIRSYSSFEGFHMGEFRFGTVFKDTSGSLLFGGDNGVIRIDPLRVNKQPYRMRPIFFTELNVNNNSVLYDPNLGTRNLLDASLPEAKTLRLSYKDNSLTLYFSAQEYASPQNVNYSYRLSGYDNSWHDTDAANARASYVSLPPGRYTFEVTGYFDEESKNSTSRSIRIIVAHPWYGSLLAWFIYSLLVVGAFFSTFTHYQNRQKQRRILEMAQHNEQVKEDKLRLFTSIAHEIRTPLTLIISPLKKLMNSGTDSETQEVYQMMHRNSLRILHVINQLLDIRKLDNMDSWNCTSKNRT